MHYDALKVYGERNTGTNYLVDLIALNIPMAMLPGTVPRSVGRLQRLLPGRLQRLLPGREWLRDRYFAANSSVNLGWKHRLVDPHTLATECPRVDRIAFVTLTKNPYSWLLSMYRRPYHQHRRGMSLDDFLRAGWPTVVRESGPPSFASPVELWNRKNAAYLTLAAAYPTVNLRYEDLLADPEGPIRSIRSRFCPAETEVEFHNSVQATKKKDGQKDFYYYRDYYLQERWRDKLSRDAILYINSKLDASIAERYGYARLEA